jgi:hypothetical protein
MEAGSEIRKFPKTKDFEHDYEISSCPTVFQCEQIQLSTPFFIVRVGHARDHASGKPLHTLQQGTLSFGAWKVGRGTVFNDRPNISRKQLRDGEG